MDEVTRFSLICCCLTILLHTKSSPCCHRDDKTNNDVRYALKDCQDSRDCDAFNLFKDLLEARAQELEGKRKFPTPNDFVGAGTFSRCPNRPLGNCSKYPCHLSQAVQPPRLGRGVVGTTSRHF